MAAQTELSILVRVKDEATAAMNKLSGSLQGAEGASKAFALGLAGAVTVAAGFGVIAVKAAADAQAEMAKVDAVIKAMGGNFDKAKASIIEASKATIKLGFDDEEAALSIAKLYQRTGDMTEAIQLNNLAMDLARAKNMDLTTASQMVGMVLSGNARVLKQYGIEIDENKKPMEALIDLQAKLRGQSEAYAQTFKGQLEVFKQQFTNLEEQIGDKLLPVLTSLIIKVNDFVTNDLQQWIDKTQEVILWLKNHQEVVIIVAGAIVGALIPAFVSAAVTLMTVTIPAFIAAAIALAPFMIAGVVVAGIVAGVLWIIKHWDLIKSKTSEVFDSVRDYLTGIWDNIKNVFQNAIDFIMNKVNIFLDAVNKVKNAANNVGSGINSGINKGLNAIGLAEGGIVMHPTLAMIGEAGEPEAVIPLSKMRNIGGPQIIITGNTLLDDDAAEKIGDMIVRRLNLHERY
jgi:hypothetical protein